MAYIGLFVVFLSTICSSAAFVKHITDTAPHGICIEYQTDFDWKFFTFLCNLGQYPATLVIAISYSVWFTQGMLCHGLIEKKSGFLTPWLFASFIAIIGLAVNFGYVSCFIDVSLIFITQI